MEIRVWIQDTFPFEIPGETRNMSRIFLVYRLDYRNASRTTFALKTRTKESATPIKQIGADSISRIVIFFEKSDRRSLSTFSIVVLIPVSTDSQIRVMQMTNNWKEPPYVSRRLYFLLRTMYRSRESSRYDPPSHVHQWRLISKLERDSRSILLW